MSATYILNFIGRLIYNYNQIQRNRKPIELDLWIIFDLITGIANILAFKIITMAEPQ